MGYSGQGEEIPYYVIVSAKSAVNAFAIAEKRRRDPSNKSGLTLSQLLANGEWSFTFGPSELFEVIPGYLWQAADGSSIWYEVRKLEQVR